MRGCAPASSTRRASRWPLELSPGNAKATANLALWALLRGDQATAERLAAQANLNDETRRSIQQQAQQIRTRLQQRQAAAVNAPAPASAASSDTAPVRRQHPAGSRTTPRST